MVARRELFRGVAAGCLLALAGCNNDAGNSNSDRVSDTKGKPGQVVLRNSSDFPHEATVYAFREDSSSAGQTPSPERTPYNTLTATVEPQTSTDYQSFISDDGSFQVTAIADERKLGPIPFQYPSQEYIEVHFMANGDAVLNRVTVVEK